MKRIFVVLIGLCAFAVWVGLSFQTAAQSETNQIEEANFTSPNLVISQFQVAGSTANDEFIELHNTSATAVDLNGYRVVYRSASGTNDVLFAEWTTAGTLVAPGSYYLIASTGYDGAIAPNYTYNPTTCQCSMSATAGGLAIRSGANNTGVIVDAVGYGGATNAFIESAATAAPAANAGQTRLNNGCQDTDNNANDFFVLNPAQPRNASSAANICGGGNSSLLIGYGANPTNISPGGTTLLTVTVFPAANPPSNGIVVTGNLSNIGLAANQQFYDDGTNGDQTAGDNIFSFRATIPNAQSGGVFNVTVNATDAQARSVGGTIVLTVNASAAGEEPLLLGNPSSATADTANENNYLLVKSQYTISYNRSRATPNWVAWRLDSTWVGGTDRQDDFRPDDALPTNWYHVLDTDYSGSGYDRGHMCPSGDRTRTVADNSATFLMTNIVPQLGDNNQGPWADFENYCRSVAQAGNELYIVSGVVGNLGTIAGGKIVVPQYTWKVVTVLPNGDNDLQRIGKGTRAIGFIVPNFPPVNRNAGWRAFRTSVDAVENLTGYNFMSNVPKNTQEMIERRRDIQ